MCVYVVDAWSLGDSKYRAYDSSKRGTKPGEEKAESGWLTNNEIADPLNTVVLCVCLCARYGCSCKSIGVKFNMLFGPVVCECLNTKNVNMTMY